MAEQKVDFYFDKALQILGNIDLEDVVKQPIRELSLKMLKRKY